MAHRSARPQYRVDDSGCWLWEWYVHRSGYGMLRQDGRARYAHRVIYERFRGPIPKGLQLDHLCRVRHCVNPDHLEPVTARENQRRGNGWPGIHARKTHCIRGHEFTPENTMIVLNGRNCAACAHMRSLARSSKAKAA